MTNRVPSLVCASLCLALACAACGGDANRAANNGAANAQAAPSATATPVSDADLNTEIERLERSAERNPGDEATRRALAAAYVRRGNAQRAAGDLRAALKDYRTALRHDEDNDEAQNSSATLAVQIEGEKTGEYGEPAPPAISPNVASDDDDDNSNAAPTSSPQPTPTPRRRT